MIDVALLYCEERKLSADYEQALKRVARSMAEAGVTPLTIRDSSFNRWLAGLKQDATTRSNYARMGMTLWRHALDCELAEHCPKRIVRVKPRNKVPVAWTMGELAALLHAARQETGRFKRSRCPMSVFFTAYIRTGFETGLRFGDLLSLRCEQLRGDRLHVVANKTGSAVPKVLSESCVQALRELRHLGDGESFFAWAICKKQLRQHFKALCKQAGLKGSPKWLRRSGATHCEIQQPGSAGRFLGHLSPGLAMRYYVDRTLLSEECPAPPPIPVSSSSG